MDFDQTVEYELWQQVGAGRPKRRSRHPYSDLKSAQKIIKDWVDEERENARMEMRKVNTRWFVVRATTTREIADA